MHWHRDGPSLATRAAPSWPCAYRQPSSHSATRARVRATRLAFVRARKPNRQERKNKNSASGEIQFQTFRDLAPAWLARSWMNFRDRSASPIWAPSRPSTPARHSPTVRASPIMPSCTRHSLSSQTESARALVSRLSQSALPRARARDVKTPREKNKSNSTPGPSSFSCVWRRRGVRVAAVPRPPGLRWFTTPAHKVPSLLRTRLSAVSIPIDTLERPCATRTRWVCVREATRGVRAELLAQVCGPLTGDLRQTHTRARGHIPKHTKKRFRAVFTPPADRLESAVQANTLSLSVTRKAKLGHVPTSREQTIPL